MKFGKVINDKDINLIKELTKDGTKIKNLNITKKEKNEILKKYYNY